MVEFLSVVCHPKYIYRAGQLQLNQYFHRVWFWKYLKNRRNIKYLSSGEISNYIQCNSPLVKFLCNHNIP